MRQARALSQGCHAKIASQPGPFSNERQHALCMQACGSHLEHAAKSEGISDKKVLRLHSLRA